MRRVLHQTLQKHLQQMPAVALLGPRQVGKTTLALQLAHVQESVYLDLESPADLLKLTDPVSFFRAHQGKLIILDEIQRAPEIFQVLRGIIDENRRLGQKTAQFLLLGSASRSLLQQSSESLAGRIRYLEMTGLCLLELETELETELDSGRKLWLRGGFPESYLASDEEAAFDWLEDFLLTYLERDLPQLGFRVPATRLRRLWTMLAHLQGETLNLSQLGSNLEVDGKTVRSYLEILTDLLLVRRLKPWHENVKKRMVKSPRYFVRDSGILHRLLGIEAHEALLSHPVLGKSWEGFVIENIHSVLPRRTESYFFRTAAGAEIDLVLKLPSGEIWAIEIKYGLSPKLGKHYNQSCQDVGATRQFLVYGGEESFPLGQTEALSLRTLLEMVQELG